MTGLNELKVNLQTFRDIAFLASLTVQKLLISLQTSFAHLEFKAKHCFVFDIMVK